VVLRIATDDSKAMCRFSTKFGAQPHDWERLVQKCVDVNVQLVGVSFHVGSGSSDDTVYPQTLRTARALFDLAATYGFDLTLIDIGGGFPGVGDWNPTFPALAAGIRPALDELFPAHVRIIGEPGRYFVARSHTLCVNVYARRMPATDDNILYYIDDGVYGSFSCIPFDHQKPVPLVFSEGRNRPMRRCNIFGPTCDSIDCIGKDIELPEVNPGEWLYFRRMGAYTCASSTHFNGFFTSKFFYVDSDRHACASMEPLLHARNAGIAAADVDCSSASSGSDSEASL
jgi:ornithine decarboxylase